MNHVHFVCQSSSPATCVQTHTLASTLQVVHWHVRLQAWSWTPSSDSDPWSSRGLLVGRWLVGWCSILNKRTMRMFKQKIIQPWCVAQNASQFPCPCAGKILETTFLMRPFKVKAFVFSLLQIAKRVSKYPLTLWKNSRHPFFSRSKCLCSAGCFLLQILRIGSANVFWNRRA